MADDKITVSNLPSIMKPLRKSGIALAREQARKIMADVNPETCEHRLGIEFDDSGSMGGEPLANAKSAVRNFLMSCRPQETSVSVWPMNEAEKPLTNDYDLVNLFVGAINKLGGTPLYTTLTRMLDSNITRGVIFSDGSPTDTNPVYFRPDHLLGGSTLKQDTINKAKEKKLALDTIFIGYAPSPGYDEMKWIAEQTGGVFVHFTDSKSLTAGLKYLSPGLRGMLMNPEIKAKIERGESI